MHHTPPPKKPRRPLSLGVQLVIFSGLAVFFIVLVSSIAFLFTSYQVGISADSAGLHIALTPRVSEDRRIEEPPYIDTLPNDYDDPDDPDEARPTPPAFTLDSSFTLEFAPRPQPDAAGISPRLSFQEIYQKCSPSVVLIEVEIGGRFMGGMGSGTGIILTEDGFIVTSAHVIEDSRQTTVILQDGTRHVAALVGMDENTDIAVLKIDANGLTPAEFGDSDLLSVGEEVCVIGNPLGQAHSMSNGIISALNRDISYGGVTMRMIQTNAAINQGNSGGPLLNLYGQVVGITNMKFIGDAVEGMGFAIPTAVFQPVVNELIAYGRIVGRASIGIVVSTVDNWTAMSEDIEPGVYVDRVLEETDAYAQGLQAGDRILYANDSPILTALDLRSVIQRHRAGDTVTLTVERNGREHVFDIILMDADLLNF